MRAVEIINKKAILWMTGMGFIFGISSLLVCIIAILNGLIDDMGVSSIILLPVSCSIVFAFVPNVAKSKVRSSYFGLVGAIRWFVFGSMTGGLYVFKEVTSDNKLLPSSMVGILSLLTFLIVYWLLFEKKGAKKTE